MDTFTPLEYLKIDIANSFGLDKLDWKDRLAWFDANEHQLHQMHKQAEEPAMFYAGMVAWHDVKHGDPIGYPISLDATASGLQFLAVCTGDRSAARLCNVIDTGHRMDAYKEIYQEILKASGGNAKIQPKRVKKAVMTAFYGSTAVPENVFGEGDLLRLFYATMEQMAPAAWDMNKTFLELWDPQTLCNSWILPDNFHVHVKVMQTTEQNVHFRGEPIAIPTTVNAPKERGRSLSANVIHSLDGFVVREMVRRCGVPLGRQEEIRTWIQKGHAGTRIQDDGDHQMRLLGKHASQCGYLSSRVLEYLQPENMGLVDPVMLLELMETLPLKPFSLITIHDCFRCLPLYGNELRAQYIYQLHMLARSDILQYLLSQLLKRPVRLQKMDPTMDVDVLSSNYALS